jgi:hypothetical protein
MKYSCQNTSELLPRNTVDDEVDGAVQDGQVAICHVHQVLPFRTRILASWRFETIHHQPVSEIGKVLEVTKLNQILQQPGYFKNSQKQPGEIKNQKYKNNAEDDLIEVEILPVDQCVAIRTHSEK